VTQADVDNGSVTETASATAPDSQGNSIGSSSASVTVQASNATSTENIAQSAAPTSYNATGNTITFTYVVKNTGTRTLANVGVTDSLDASVSCPDATLAPGASETCSGVYTLTQADVAAGSVTSTASAHATDPQRNAITSSSTLTVDATGLRITTTSLPGGSVYSRTNKVTYSTTLTATRGKPPYKWKLAAGSAKPPKGLTLKSTGVISGHAKAAGFFCFTVEVLDTKTKTKPHTQNTATASFSINIVAS
jgi:uncharacterized repeat protein (TIGR01451 family)